MAVHDSPAAALAACRMGDAQMGHGPDPCTSATVRDMLNSRHQGEVRAHNSCEDIVTFMPPTGIHASDLRETALNSGPAAFVAAQRAEQRYVVSMRPQRLDRPGVSPLKGVLRACVLLFETAPVLP